MCLMDVRMVLFIYIYIYIYYICIYIAIIFIIIIIMVMYIDFFHAILLVLLLRFDITGMHSLKVKNYSNVLLAYLVYKSVINI